MAGKVNPAPEDNVGHPSSTKAQGRDTQKPGLALRGSERVPVTIRGHKRRSPAPAMPLVGSTSSAAPDYGRAQQSTAAAETRLGDGRLWCSENKRTARIEPHTALIYLRREVQRRHS